MKTMSTMCQTALIATQGETAGAGALRVAAAAGDVAMIEELNLHGTSCARRDSARPAPGTRAVS